MGFRLARAPAGGNLGYNTHRTARLRRMFPRNQRSGMRSISQILAKHGIVDLEGMLAQRLSTDPISFEEYLDRFAPLVSEVVNEFLPRGTHADMDRYLYDPLHAYSKNAGKCHRPVITFAAARAVGGDMQRATSAAAAIEHFHSAALIHDDIADDGKTRRGAPCMHLTEGLALALNVGDLALSLVNGTVAADPTLDDHTKVRVITELVNMTQRTVEGQAMDLGWARDCRYDITEQDYFAMATHKTAYYSGAVPLVVGAIIGGGTETQIEGLRNYGMDTGLAFQIQDDLLNLVGTEESTKKDFRSDITEGKRTLVVVHALANVPPDFRRYLIEVLSSHETDPDVLAKVVRIFEEAGSIDYARKYAENLTKIAKNRLREILAPGDARELLLSMADWFVSRLN